MDYTQDRYSSFIKKREKIQSIADHLRSNHYCFIEEMSDKQVYLSLLPEGEKYKIKENITFKDIARFISCCYEPPYDFDKFLRTQFQEDRECIQKLIERKKLPSLLKIIQQEKESWERIGKFYRYSPLLDSVNSRKMTESQYLACEEITRLMIKRNAKERMKQINY